MDADDLVAKLARSELIFDENTLLYISLLYYGSHRDSCTAPLGDKCSCRWEDVRSKVEQTMRARSIQYDAQMGS